MTPEDPSQPFWDYLDLALFLGLALPTMLASYGIVRLARLSPLLRLGKEPEALAAQFVWYALLFTCLYGLLRLRYRQPFWRAMGWTFPGRALWAAVPEGIFLAFAVGAIGTLLRAKPVPLPFDEMLKSRLSIFVLGVFVVVLGPLCEELAFRGLIMPLLVRQLGVVPGILLTALPFALLHGPQYQWSWQHIALILTAGYVFGYARWKSGSTAVSTLLHAVYNLVFFSAFLLQSKLVKT